MCQVAPLYIIFLAVRLRYQAPDALLEFDGTSAAPKLKTRWTATELQCSIERAKLFLALREQLVNIGFFEALVEGGVSLLTQTVFVTREPVALEAKRQIVLSIVISVVNLSKAFADLDKEGLMHVKETE